MSEFAKDSLSLEETNRLRISLGLKPLTDDSASDSKGGTDAAEEKPKDKDELAEDNYRQRREQEAKRKEEEEVRQRIAKAQNKRELRRQLRGATLGDTEASESTSGPSDSKATLKWLKQAQKKAKEHAEKRARELEEQEAAAQASYGEADLAGLKVAHDVEDFELGEGDEGRVLTLRDSRILDDAEDELMDASLEQKEIDRLNEERKKGPKKYTGLDDEEMEDAQLGRKRGVLSKYDADIPGSGMREADGGFRLGGSTETSAERKETRRRELEEAARRKNRTLLNLDYTKNQEVSDYLAPGDVGFKKSKKKSKKRAAVSRIKLDAEPEEGAHASDGPSMEVDTKPMQHARRQVEERDNLVDDDELAASLARARRAKANKALGKMTPEEIAKNLAAQREAEEAEERRDQMVDSPAMGDDASAAANGAEDGGLTFDETSEFIRNIAHRPSSPDLATRRRERERSIKQEESSPQEDSLPSVQVKQEPQDGGLVDADSLLAPDAALPDEDGQIKDEEMERLDFDYPPSTIRDSEAPPSMSPELGIGTSAEPTVAGGVAGTLNLLRSQGLIEGMTPEQRRREAAQKQYDTWKARRLAEEALREEERRISKLQGSAKDQATREYENKMRELDEARRAEERFRDYKPDVDIKYHDQYGRQLNNHEAWKLLSHTFHGKMPGKAKQEKYKRKVEEERKRERMAAGEAHDMSKAFRERQQREGQAHMVLSVGAKGNAPQDFADHLGPNLVRTGASGSAAGAGKGKAKALTGGVSASQGQNGTSSVTSMAFDGMRSVSASALSPSMAGIASVMGNGSGSGVSSTTPGPRMRPAFQPISSTASTAVGARDGGSTTPHAGGGTAPGSGIGKGFKLALGAGAKRKADEQGGRE